MDGKTSDWRPGPSVCRCCLAEGCYKDISTEYFWMGKREVYADMLSDTFSVSIAYSSAGGPNSHSRLICEPCISRLRDAADFKRQVQECERTFMQHLDPGSTSAANDIDIEAQPAGKEVKLEQVKLEKRFSDDDFDTADFGDEDDDDMDDQPLTKFATKVPKKEAVDFLDLIDNSQITVKRMSMSKSKAPPAKKVKVTKKEPAKPTASKAPIKVVKEKKKKGSAVEAELGIKRGRKLKEVVTARQMRRRRRANNELPEESDKRIAKTMMRRNAMTILECSTAWAFRWFHGAFYCSYCESKHVDIHPFREHVRLNHLNQPPTKKVFSKLTENNMVKIDVADLSCRFCNRILSGIGPLKEHLIIHNRTLNTDYSDGVLPFKLDDDGFYCQMCFTYFHNFARINEHMNSHYKNYICDTCGKAFISKSRFRKHVQSHEKGSFPCGSCDEVLETRAARMFHRMRVHRKGIRYTCPRCTEVFTSYHTRVRHLVDVHGQQKIEYGCDVCGKTFETSSKRAGHFRIAHTTEKRHECLQCSSYFGTKSKLARHMKSHSVN
ncbi:zinc finger protein 599 isoform X21 [Manduca sexta]|uniref:zinc finger protein 599 isoform X21 n=1 Tax=Manduca sexta TaxID=7130 RepID=UPI00188E3114|nr:zinc finger protein 599 isoform X21 [Manduca sexta]